MARMTREQLAYLQQRIYELQAEAHKIITDEHGVRARLPTWKDLWDMVDANEITAPNISLRKYTNPDRYHSDLHVGMFIPDEILEARFPKHDKLSERGKKLCDMVDEICQEAMDEAMLGDAADALAKLIAKLDKITK